MTPGGMRLRPRVSTRERISPRRETMRISTRWLSPRLRASSVLGVGTGLDVIIDLHPVEIQLAVMQHAVLLHGVVTRLFRDDAVRDAPDFLGMFTVFRVGHRHVGRQAMGEGAHLARRAAGRGLAGERERAVARLGNLTRQQMDVVDHLVGPDAAHMLVEPHGPQRHDLAVRVGIKLGQRLEEAHTRIREMSTQEVERRVDHTVLRLSQQAGRKELDGIRIDFPISRQDIAEMTGTTLHTVSRILSSWESKGLVKGGRQKLLVCNLPGLAQLAEGEASQV